jgi:hypothetical protein
MNRSPSECIDRTAGVELADRIIRELLRIARQWVVLRFLVDEESRQGGPVQLSDISSQPFHRQAALYTVISELSFQGPIKWTRSPESRHPGPIRLTAHGRQFVVHTLDRLHQGSIQQTINNCRCADLEQLLELLGNVFYRLET